MSRLIFNLLVVASGALIRGGTVSVRISQDSSNNKIISIVADGANMRWDPEMEKVFSGKLAVSELTPKNVQAYLTKSFATELGAVLTWKVDNDKLSIQLIQATGGL